MMQKSKSPPFEGGVRGGDFHYIPWFYIFSPIIITMTENMKNFSTKLLILIFTVPVSLQLYTQDDLDGILFAGIDNANTLTENYMRPFMVGFGAANSNGWYTTAATHKPLGFELLITVQGAFAPSDEDFF